MIRPTSCPAAVGLLGASLLAASLVAAGGASAQAAPAAPPVVRQGAPAAATTSAHRRASARALAHRFTARAVTSADGTRIAYLSAGPEGAGAGRPLVMVHGSMTVADEWLAVADGLAATRRVVVVERRGRGRSGDAVRHSLAVEAQDLAAVVAEVGGPAAVDLFGHSYGGAVVGRYAIDSAFAGAVVLYDPGAGLNGPIADGWLGPVRALLDAGRREEALTRAFETVMGLPAPAVAAFRGNAPLWAQFRALLPSWLREIDAITAFAPTAEEFARVRGHTTILLGDRSGPMLTAIAGTWVGRQPGITVLPLRGQGHTGYLDAPASVAERMQAALAP